MRGDDSRDILEKQALVLLDANILPSTLDTVEKENESESTTSQVLDIDNGQLRETETDGMQHFPTFSFRLFSVFHHRRRH